MGFSGIEVRDAFDANNRWLQRRKTNHEFRQPRVVSTHNSTTSCAIGCAPSLEAWWLNHLVATSAATAQASIRWVFGGVQLGVAMQAVEMELLAKGLALVAHIQKSGCTTPTPTQPGSKA